MTGFVVQGHIQELVAYVGFLGPPVKFTVVNVCVCVCVCVCIYRQYLQHKS